MHFKKTISLLISLSITMCLFCIGFNVSASDVSGDFTMKYYIGRNSYNFNGSNAKADNISGVEIRANKSTSFYIQYRTWNEGIGGFFSPVTSNINDYAGSSSGRVIQLLEMKAFDNQGGKISTGIVIMYRVRIDTGWLSWVSNANPDWMRSAMYRYHLDGTIDEKGSNAGIVGHNIKEMEIHIYQDDSIITEPILGSNNKVINTENIYQKSPDNYFPTGCESVSTVMALNYSGFNITVSDFVDNYLPLNPDRINFNPNTHFGGNPRTDSGIGCYQDTIVTACNKYLYGKNYQARKVSANSISELCTNYIDKDIPVIIWATSNMAKWESGKSPYANGNWIIPEHCLLLVGYDDYYYVFKDPLNDKYQTLYLKSDCEDAFSGLFKQAVIIENTTPSINVPNSNPSVNEKELINTDLFKNITVNDDINARNKSFSLNYNLFKLDEENGLKIDAHYDSSCLSNGMLGIGFYFDYEKHIVKEDNIIKMYFNNIEYIKFELNEDGQYYSDDFNYSLSVLSDDEGYLINYNDKLLEKYDMFGRLSYIKRENGTKQTIINTDSLMIVKDVLTDKSIYLKKENGKITEIYDNLGHNTTLTFSGDYLTAINDNANKIIVSYTDNGLIDFMFDNKYLFKNSYNQDGRITKFYSGTSDDTFEISYPSENDVQIKNSNGVYSYQFDENSMLTKYIDKEGSQKFSFDKSENMVTVIKNELGDINDDNIIDVKDFIRLKKYISDNSTSSNYDALDINCDGKVNSIDLINLQKYLLTEKSSSISVEKYKI